MYIVDESLNEGLVDMKKKPEPARPLMTREPAAIFLGRSNDIFLKLLGKPASFISVILSLVSTRIVSEREAVALVVDSRNTISVQRLSQADDVPNLNFDIVTSCSVYDPM